MSEYNRNDYPGLFVRDALPHEAEIIKVEETYDASKGCDKINVTFETEVGIATNTYTMTKTLGSYSSSWQMPVVLKMRCQAPRTRRLSTV